MGSERVRLLVVDDDAAMRSLLAETLAAAGRFAVTAAATGEEALALLAQGEYDLVLTDLCLPGMDGLELLRRLRARRPAPVVVAMTGYGSVRDAASLVRHGAFDVLPKPFRLEELTLVLDRALTHHRLAARARELERRLETAERLAAIGKLAAGVAHEVNNPLDGIRRFLRLARERLAEPDRAAGYLEEALGGLDRIVRLVRALLAFSRAVGSSSPPKPAQEIVTEALHLAGDDPPAVTVTLQDPQLPLPGALVHVLANLVRNARQASGPDGTVSLTVAAAGSAATVTVRDSGPGVPPELRERIFEPFFTTKPVGAGTGLGLALCREIVTREGGSIEVAAAPGGGAEFRIRLPREPASPEPSAPPTLAGKEA